MAEKKFLATITRTVDIDVVVWAESEDEARSLVQSGEGDWEEIQQEDIIDNIINITEFPS